MNPSSPIFGLDARRYRSGLQGQSIIYRHIARTGLTLAGTAVWTSDEIAILRRHHVNREALPALLPRRTVKAIGNKLRRLGLVCARRIWNAQETAALRSPYRTGVPIDDLLTMFPGKSKRQIWGKAFAIGVRRPRRAPKPTGLALVDDVRARAFAYRLSMTDLDSFLGTHGYFVRPRHLNWSALHKAIELLGGMPELVWRDVLVS
ncbi:hypothetical protein [Novosphingobium sp. CECT 9465]|uniref:hypothetical protein n=1 Tax=Novosphingobium sp. CECT 9465 TaxID=2829794 RepID=UPI001E5C41B4|nr:hypothetical protein [Novosphingobium sp. CECT 9465]CAH0496457.1 hypothetical protein NVSP9465_01491 [Novosphingobium sp. CECT 9465]